MTESATRKERLLTRLCMLLAIALVLSVVVLRLPLRALPEREPKHHDREDQRYREQHAEPREEAFLAGCALRHRARLPRVEDVRDGNPGRAAPILAPVRVR